MPPRRGQGLLNAEQLANESFECDDEDVLPPFAGPPACSALEITGFIKKGGLLTKRISLSADGGLISDGSACLMSTGYAWRQRFDKLEEFGAFVNNLHSNQALALGSLTAELSEVVEVVSKRRLQKPSSDARYDTISRTREYLEYRSGCPTLILFDFDSKGMPPEVRRRVDQFGGYWPALTSVISELATAARVVRASTSAGICRADTGQAIGGSDGQHNFVIIPDGSDAERFLRDLHDRCWLTGLGWCRVDAAGRLLHRSLVDQMVGRPERLVFEGPPDLDPALVQDTETRRAVAVEGEILDSAVVCPPLSSAEEADLAELRAREAERLAPECATARQAFLKRQARRLIERHPSMSQDAAARAIQRQVEGVLLPWVELDFVDETLVGTTVADVLKNPERYRGEKLADPIEGREYDRDCAYINLHADGSPWIYSFAHGETIYELKFDAITIEQAIETAQEGEQAAELFVKIMMLADDLDPIEVDRLKDLVCKRSGIGPRTLMASLRKARAKVRRERWHDENNEPRPGTISLEDFYANLEMHNYIYTPTGKMWPAASVNARVSSQTLMAAGKPVFSESGNPIMIDANEWLDAHRAVEQITWVPGLPMIIRDKYVVEGGWVDRPNASCFNLYLPPRITLGDPSDISPWMDHLVYVYPDDVDHITNWLSHRVQRPQEKLNHGLVLGGPQGIGKDTILEPVRNAIGPWNFKEASPKQVLGRFNAYLKSVILRISLDHS